MSPNKTIFFIVEFSICELWTLNCTYWAPWIWIHSYFWCIYLLIAVISSYFCFYSYIQIQIIVNALTYYIYLNNIFLKKKSFYNPNSYQNRCWALKSKSIQLNHCYYRTRSYTFQHRWQEPKNSSHSHTTHSQIECFEIESDSTETISLINFLILRIWNNNK